MMPPPAAASLAQCFHCGEAVPAGTRWRTTIDGAIRPMCCPGCLGVAETIVALGQASYYRERAGYGAQGPAPGLPPQLVLYDEDVQRFARSGDSYQALLAVDGIHCAACVWLIERRLGQLPGVLEVQLNVATERLQVRWDGRHCKLSAIIGALHGIGYGASPYDATRQAERLRLRARSLLRRLFVAGLCMMQVMMYAWPAYLADDGSLEPALASLLQWASLLLTLPVMAYSAAPIFRQAWAGVRARVPGMDVPVALGLGAAFVASALATLRGQGEVYYDSVTMFVFLLLCSRYLELSARRKAAAALDALHAALPASAWRLDDYPAAWSGTTVAVAALAPGDLVLVKPGEACPADALIVAGTARLDLSLLTGESAPQARAPGEQVPGGAVNAGQALVLRVTAAAADSTLAGLVRLVEGAGLGRPRMAQWADVMAARFVVALLLFALAVLAWWSWWDPVRAWPIAIAVLVVSCPCALSLATPSALAAATDALLRQGVLIVRPHVLETLHRATHIVFDKTGTLTVGRPRVVGSEILGSIDRAACFAIAAAMEQGSAHPLAAAFAGETIALAVTRIEEVRGMGIEAWIGGARYRLGSAAFAQELAGCTPPRAPGSSGEVFLARRGGWLARFSLDDPIRPEAAALVRQCRLAGRQVILLSGDAGTVARQVGGALGIDIVEADCSPEAKLAYVRALQAQGAVVAMVGDGINDAAVLRGADVSFAMGSGAPLAQLQADAVLLSGRLAPFELAMRHAGAAMAVIRQNLAWALLYNTLAIPAAALGYVTPLVSGIGMAASSALVVANALRLRRI